MRVKPRFAEEGAARGRRPSGAVGRALALAALLGLSAGGCSGAAPDEEAAPEPGGGEPAHEVDGACRTEPFDPSEVPPEVRELAADGPIVGEGSIWVVVPSADWVIRDATGADGSETLSLKLGWFRVTDDELSIEVERTDGPGQGGGRVPDGYGPTGFQPSRITFDAPGCWRITGRHGDATVAVLVQVPG